MYVIGASDRTLGLPWVHSDVDCQSSMYSMYIGIDDGTLSSSVAERN